MPRKKGDKKASNEKRVANQKEKRRAISSRVIPVVKDLNVVKKEHEKELCKNIKAKTKAKTAEVINELKERAKKLYEEKKKLPLMFSHPYTSKLKSLLKE